MLQVCWIPSALVEPLGWDAAAIDDLASEISVATQHELPGLQTGNRRARRRACPRLAAAQTRVAVNVRRPTPGTLG